MALERISHYHIIGTLGAGGMGEVYLAEDIRLQRKVARVWLQQGRSADARAGLAAIYGWFTEGFDTKDMREAKVLLAELTS